MVGFGSRWIALGSCVLGLLAACGNSDGASHSGSGGARASGGVAAATGGNAGAAQGGAASGGVSSGGANSASGGQAQGGGGATSGGAPSNGGSANGGAANGGSANQGGSGGDAGEAGAGGNNDDELQPVGTVPPDKIDLLFVIDNSLSMGDKQEILKNAVPLLVRRLVTPVCVDAAGNPNGQLASPSGVCAGGQPEFPPIRDFHIAVVTSSLGGHGSQTCATSSSDTNDDRAHLLPSVRTGLTSWNDSGFLAWDPEQRAVPPGANDAVALVSDFQNMVVAAGEKGCGFESTLEAWYRFLIDPSPPASVTLNSTSQTVEVTAPDPVTLAQRQAFLRQDSLLGIVMLSDENDCSIIDSGQGYLVGTQSLSGGTFRMPRSTSACAQSPNDACCRSCAASTQPTGCAPAADDSECKKGSYLPSDDSLNLRCWDQKRRFGFDFLYPLQRYLSALTQSQVTARDGTTAENPLFKAAPGVTHRDPSHVFLLGILGVPWQDVADDASLNDSVRVHYLSAAELEAKGRFSMILGDNGSRPSDGLMFETNLDRSTLGFAAHPLTGEAIAPSNSANPKQNRINGHESSITDGSDLQYSCVFPLVTPRDCSTSTSGSCDCRSSDATYNRALCQPPSGGPAGTMQYFAKAYPSLRQLELIRQFGGITNNSIAASICPKVQMAGMPTTDPNYGYNPAVTALVDRMKVALAPSCLAEPIVPDANGAVACHVLEVTNGTGGCGCTGVGRSTPSAASAAAIRGRLAHSLYCDGVGQPSCDSLCVCEVNQLASSELTACQNDVSVPAGSAGFCYLDAAQKLGDASMLQDCPVDRKRRLRFVGTDIPRPGSATYVFCPR